MAWWSRLWNTFRNDRLIDDIDEELSSHLAEAIDEGRDPRVARRALGPALRHREASRDLRRIVWLGDFLADVRFGARVLRHQPVFLATALLSLGIGIGANTAIFSAVDGLLLRSLPVTRADQLVVVADRVTSNFSYPEYVGLRDGTHTLSDLVAASHTIQLPVDVAGEVALAGVKVVSGNYFSALGIRPELGRLFLSADETQRVAVVSDAYWRRQWAAGRDAVGGVMRVDGVTVQIVGVVPAGFFGEAPGESPDIWTSIALQPPNIRADRGYSWLYLLGRRKAGGSLEAVHDDLASPLIELRPTASAAETRSRLTVAPGAGGLGKAKSLLADPLRIAMMLAGVVLVIVCTNLAALMLARATTRREEIAMRLAIGASGGRVIRQLLTESLLLACAGGVLGLVVGMWSQSALLRLPLGKTPVVLPTGLNLRILGFTGAVAVAAGLLFGLAPAWRATREAAARGSARVIGTRGRSRVRSGLIATQVALSMVLVSGTIMFTRTIRNLEDQDLGFQAGHVLVMPVVAERGYGPNLGVLVPALLGRVSQIPGVTAATVAVGGTLNAMGGARVQVDGRPVPERVEADWVGPDYFRTAGLDLVAGRDFSRSDDERHPNVVIINQTMARQHFGESSALGRGVTLNGTRYEIVGVAGGAKYADLREATPAFIYFSTLQTHTGINELEVRTAADPLAMASTVAPMIHDIDPHLRAGVPATLSDRIHLRLAPERVVADVAGLFGALAIVLLAIGIYGTVACSVGQRAKEIAVRMALGAQRAAIVWMVLRQMVGLMAGGLLAGGIAVAFVGQLVKPLLFGVAPVDPATITLASGALMVTAAIAAGLPARAASQLDPAAVLQE